MTNQESTGNFSFNDAALLAVVGALGALGIAGTIYDHRNKKREDLIQELQQKEDAKQDKIWQAFYENELAEGQKPIYATVMEERAGMHDISKSRVIESRTINVPGEAATYVLRVRTDPYTDHGTNSVPSKILAINVVDGGITKETLEALIVNGSRISFPRGNIAKCNPSSYNQGVGDMARYGYFNCGGDNFTPETQGGTKAAGQIRVLPNTEVQAEITEFK